MSTEKLASIGAIALLASHTEHYAERAIWALEGIKRDKKGSVWTDAKQITELIDKLEELVPSIPHMKFSEFVRAWCGAARLAFSCRNSLFHGRTWGLGDEWAVFSRNEPIAGERRKRPSSEFHASQNTLNLLEEAFGYLLNGVYLIGIAAGANVPLGDFKEPLSEVRRAWSIAAELDDLATAVNHEKY
jgi:hypothetical protein